MEDYEIIKKLIFDYVSEIAMLQTENKKLLESSTSSPPKLEIKQIPANKGEIEDLFEEYLKTHGLTYQLSLILNPYLEETMSLDPKPESNIPKPVDKPKVIEDKLYVPNTRNKIGYCKIEDNKHFICFNERECYLLMGLDDKTYFQQGQFVSVDENYFFKWSHKYLHIPSDEAVSEYLRISYIEGKLTALNADNISVKIDFPKYSNFKEGQIISLDKYGRFSRFYKTSKFCYDNFADSIYSRNLKVTTPKSTSDSSLVLEDIKSKEIYTLKYDISEAIKMKIDDDSVVILNKNFEIANVIQSQYFLGIN